MSGIFLEQNGSELISPQTSIWKQCAVQGMVMSTLVVNLVHYLKVVVTNGKKSLRRVIVFPLKISSGMPEKSGVHLTTVYGVWMMNI